jgi:selenocysteine lyase/cysteine desulfurase
MSRTAKSRRDFLKHSLAAGALATIGLRDDSVARVLAAQTRVRDRPTDEVAADEDYWREIQQAFAIDRSLINLNNGGVSPSPRVVLDALRRHMEFSNNAPAKTMWGILDPEVETVRARLARAFGCLPDELAITRNSSEALETCIYGIDLKPSDEVLTTDQDYPRMLSTYRQRELREGIVLKTVPVPAPVDDPAELLDVFAKNITAQTRVILCCQVVNITGQIFPVREIVRLGREHGIPVIVDGAHAFAHLAFNRDDLDCDYYGTSLHKWLTAPHGTGFLYVRKDRIESLWPLMAAVKPRSDDIRKYEEIGTHPAATRLAISEAVTLHNGIGPQRKEARLRYLRDRWARRLSQDRRVKLYCRLEPQHSCGIATFAIADIDPTKLAEHLFTKHRIITVAIDHATIKGVRVTPNVYTTFDEIDMFCEAVENVLANGLPT